ncbi:hypothetical protein D9M68_680490 [compost metagenome]
MCLSKKRQHMMFTHGEDFNIFYHYHLTIVFSEHSRPENFFRFNIISMGKILQCLCHPFWGLQQAFTLRIFSKVFQNIFIMTGYSSYFPVVVTVYFLVAYYFLIVIVSVVIHLSFAFMNLFIRQNILHNYFLFRRV